MPNTMYARKRRTFASSPNAGPPCWSCEVEHVLRPRLCQALGFFVSQRCQQSRGSGGRGRETQRCRHFWTRFGSSHLQSVNSHGVRGGCGRETQNCRHFWTRLAPLRLKSANNQGSAKRRSVVPFGLVSGLRVSKVSTVTGIGGVVVARGERRG